MIDRNHALPITRQAELVGMSRSLVTDALRMAWFWRHPEPGLIVAAQTLIPASRSLARVLSKAAGSHVPAPIHSASLSHLHACQLRPRSADLHLLALTLGLLSAPLSLPCR